jgi:hypothetical protein
MEIYYSTKTGSSVGGPIVKYRKVEYIFQKETYTNRYECLYLYNNELRTMNIKFISATEDIKIYTKKSYIGDEFPVVSIEDLDNYEFQSTLSFEDLVLKPNEFISLILKAEATTNTRKIDYRSLVQVLYV